jgi:hypothetical protein
MNNGIAVRKHKHEQNHNPLRVPLKEEDLHPAVTHAAKDTSRACYHESKALVGASTTMLSSPTSSPFGALLPTTAIAPVVTEPLLAVPSSQRTTAAPMSVFQLDWVLETLLESTPRTNSGLRFHLAWLARGEDVAWGVLIPLLLEIAEGRALLLSAPNLESCMWRWYVISRKLKSIYTV